MAKKLQVPPSQRIYQCKMLRVIDGDTFSLFVDLGFGAWTKQRIRLKGVDAYETRLGEDTGEAEKYLGIAAKDFVESLFLESKVCTIETYQEKGKYGRYIAELYASGHNVGMSLVELGLGVRGSL